MEALPAVAETVLPGGNGEAEAPLDKNPGLRHYDSHKDVILRVEWITDQAMQNLTVTVQILVITGAALLAAVVALKEVKGNDLVFMPTIPTMNLVFGAGCMLELLFTCAVFYARVVIANRSGKRWDPKRRRAVVLTEIELGTQTLNMAAFLTTNAIQLADRCTFFPRSIVWLGLVQWLCWNTLCLISWVHADRFRPVPNEKDSTLARPGANEVPLATDLPLTSHWRKLALWLAFLGTTVATNVKLADGPADRASGLSQCDASLLDCRQTAGLLVGQAISIVLIILYLLLYLYATRRSLQQLSRFSYNRFRVGNRLIRIQIRLRVLAVCVFLLCCILYALLQFSSCVSYWVSWLGFLPMQVITTAIVAGQCFLDSPKQPSDKETLLAFLQEFAWTEASQPAKRAARSASLKRTTGQAEGIDKEPMWCFETAVKLMHWCSLCYAFDKADTSVALKTAMELYHLEEYEMIWEERVDTLCLLAWGPGTVVVAFRGTASMAGLIADMKIWRTPWPPAAGTWRSRPKVHTGFLHCYRSGELDVRLARGVRRAVQRAARAGAGPVRVLVTGHSLGGALGMLCAYDVARAHPGLDVSCYTFGTPRVGNRAFADLYGGLVPDTWHVVNGDDTITRSGKFFFLYKRVGHRVLINGSGDLIVRPDYIEKYVHRMPGGGSLYDHYLSSYRTSFAAVLLAQFGAKAISGGKSAATVLAHAPGTQDMLREVGLTIDDLKTMERHDATFAGCYDASGLCTCCFLLSCPRLPTRGRKGSSNGPSSRLASQRPGQATSPLSNFEEDVTQDAVREVALGIQPFQFGSRDFPAPQLNTVEGRV
ncbi:hypothetical protein ACKKBF_B36685 [Auxenochlorella protothecoides x Auxenochlorella symbiontica]